MSTAYQLTDPIAQHGEGPVWFAAREELRWVDMMRGRAWVLRPGADPWAQDFAIDILAAMRPRRTGGAILATRAGLALQADLDDSTVAWIADIDLGLADRLNEGGCDPHGRFYCGSMAAPHTPATAALYRLDTDHSVEIVETGIGISNGLDWSPSGDLAYYVDSSTGRIDVFDYERDGGLTGRRPFVAISAEVGVPDGLTVDREGFVWVALWDGYAVHRYRPDGVLDDRIDVPTRRVTACTFGGDALDTLFVTTSTQGVNRDEDELAGALFSVSTGPLGLPTREFG